MICMFGVEYPDGFKLEINLCPRNSHWDWVANTQ